MFGRKPDSEKTVSELMEGAESDMRKAEWLLKVAVFSLVLGVCGHIYNALAT